MNIEIHRNQERRFWNNVEIIEDKDSCWLWKGKLLSTGYARFSISYREFKAHRIAYLLEYGCFDGKLLVLHRCDIRHCVRPSHLFLGDAKLNASDRTQKGRGVRVVGASHPFSKFTPNQILFMRKKRREGTMTQKDLVRYFGVSKSTISYAVRGISYDNVPFPDDSKN